MPNPTMQVPTVTTLKDIYSEDALDVQKGRWEKLLEEFKKRYGRSPDFVSRSPGRVNIIGEHIDYSLYSVFPMAITADVLIAVAVSEKPVVKISNVNSSKFGSEEFEVPAEGEIPIDPENHSWTNYFKAGLRAGSELLQKLRKQSSHFRSVGMDVLVDGTVPSGGGLSSSAAFVCSSALATLKANGEEVVDKKELTELAIVSERAVGVNSGGMDQSASVFPERGSAVYVSFVPELSAKPVEFPETDELNFMIANSFVAADKHTTGPVCYNLRVVECTLAAVFLSRVFNLQTPLPEDSSPLGVSLRGFHDIYFQEKDGIKDNSKTSVEDFAKQLEQLLQLTDDYLHQEDGYTRDQIAGLLGISVDELEKRYMSKFPVRADKFKLRQRALHVFGEAIRVNKFMGLLSTHSSSHSKDEVQALLKELGSLMNTTQDSCRDLYECSCPELDELCDLARSAGAYGSRLTGAGWGGCSVHLVPKGRVENVKKNWVEKYYRKKWPDISEERLAEAIVVSRPGSGSAVFRFSGDSAGVV